MACGTPEQRRLQKQRRYKRRMEEGKRLLGGKCACCGKRWSLQFDHVEPSTKEFEICRGHMVSYARFLLELAKCQLLCFWCHSAKTAEENRARYVGVEETSEDCPF